MADLDEIKNAKGVSTNCINTLDPRMPNDKISQHLQDFRRG